MAKEKKVSDSEFKKKRGVSYPGNLDNKDEDFDEEFDFENDDVPKSTSNDEDKNNVKTRMSKWAFFGLTVVWEIVVCFLILFVLIILGDKKFTMMQGFVGICAFFICMAVVPTWMYAKNGG
jgi:hypothetical protein